MRRSGKLSNGKLYLRRLIALDTHPRRACGAPAVTVPEAQREIAVSRGRQIGLSRASNRANVAVSLRQNCRR
jgi:hypothetical protein